MKPLGPFGPHLQHHAHRNRWRQILTPGWVVIALLVVGIAVAATVVSINRGSKSTTADTGNQTTTATTSIGTATTPSAAAALGGAPLPPFTPTADLGANCQYPPSSQAAAKPVDPPRPGKVPTSPAQVALTMVTSQGNIGLQLDNGKSPCTVNSFVSLAQKGFFNETDCHRLTEAPTLGVLQCGDPKGDGTGGPGYQFANEYPTDQYQPGDPGLHQPVVYPRGTLAMANAGPNTNGSQFFIVYKDSQLPPEYTLFGTVDNPGLATLDNIAKAGVAGGGEDGRPANVVTILSLALV